MTNKPQNTKCNCKFSHTSFPSMNTIYHNAISTVSIITREHLLYLSSFSHLLSSSISALFPFIFTHLLISSFFSFLPFLSLFIPLPFFFSFSFLPLLLLILSSSLPLSLFPSPHLIFSSSHPLPLPSPVRSTPPPPTPHRWGSTGTGWTGGVWTMSHSVFLFVCLN